MEWDSLLVILLVTTNLYPSFCNSDVLNPLAANQSTTVLWLFYFDSLNLVCSCGFMFVLCHDLMLLLHGDVVLVNSHDCDSITTWKWFNLRTTKTLSSTNPTVDSQKSINTDLDSRFGCWFLLFSTPKSDTCTAKIPRKSNLTSPQHDSYHSLRNFEPHR